MKKLIILLMIPILMQGQTVTEKIKAKFKQINDAKIERLKECEGINDKRDSTWYEKGIGWRVEVDTVYAMRNRGWLKEFITLWDEYAKERYADSTVYLSEHYIENNRLISKYHYTHKQPDLIGFIEFLRNKLKEN